MKHPRQKMVMDEDGMVRFQANQIVRHLLDHGDVDMNRLAMMHFEDEDRIQFAQLIGYSIRGFGELSYVPLELARRCDKAATRVK